MPFYGPRTGSERIRNISHGVLRLQDLHRPPDARWAPERAMSRHVETAALAAAHESGKTPRRACGKQGPGIGARLVRITYQVTLLRCTAPPGGPPPVPGRDQIRHRACWLSSARWGLDYQWGNRQLQCPPRYAVTAGEHVEAKLP